MRMNYLMTNSEKIDKFTSLLVKITNILNEHIEKLKNEQNKSMNVNLIEKERNAINSVNDILMNLPFDYYSYTNIGEIMSDVLQKSNAFLKNYEPDELDIIDRIKVDYRAYQSYNDTERKDSHDYTEILNRLIISVNSVIKTCFIILENMEFSDYRIKKIAQEILQIKFYKNND